MGTIMTENFHQKIFKLNLYAGTSLLYNEIVRGYVSNEETNDVDGGGAITFHLKVDNSSFDIVRIISFR